MYQIFIGSLALSTIHALIPNHWLPLIAIGKTEKWSLRRTLWAAVITGVAHTLSTILVGIGVGLAGYKLAAHYEVITGVAAPAILVVLGIIYVFIDISGKQHPGHSHDHTAQLHGTGKAGWVAILTSLSVAMFLTPCIEIEAYYFQAGTVGWPGIFVVSAVYLLITVIVMLILVYAGVSGTRTLRTGFLERHDKLVTGVVLIVLGIVSIFVRF